jgi:translation initiation factor 2B subunit (eIF-2B alpha/beta/delta family)
MPRTPWRTALDQLRSDHRSGAAEITLNALHMLIDVVGDSVPDSADAYRKWLVRTSRELVAAQPAMASLFRLVNDMLWETDAAATGERVRQGALTYLQNYQARNEAALDGLVQHAVEFLAHHTTIMTYSRSSTVARVLQALREGNRNLHVYCSEGRPVLEGQALASELAWAEIDVTLGVDMALFGWLGEVRALVVGADSLSATGLANKIGTAPLMRAAAERELPRVVLCTTAKLLPGDYVLQQGLRFGDPEEIMPVSSKRLTVHNVYFDITPLDLVSTVITERGPLQHAELLDELSGLHTYPGLRGK